MSIKRYCDCCGKEMKEITEAGHLVVIKKMLLDANQKIQKRELDLCEFCVNRVWSLLEEIKKEIKNLPPK